MWKVKVKSLSRVQLFETPWTAAHQAPPPMGFSRQEYLSLVPFICFHTSPVSLIKCIDFPPGGGGVEERNFRICLIKQCRALYQPAMFHFVLPLSPPSPQTCLWARVLLFQAIQCINHIKCLEVALEGGPILYPQWFIQVLLPNKYQSVQFSHSAVSSSLQPHGLQHARLPCPSPTPRACSNSCPSGWYHPTISSSVVPFSSCLQPFPASGS